MTGFVGQAWVMLGAISGFLSVALGAFGAHALRGSLSVSSLAIYQTGNLYQMVHSLALVGLGLWQSQLKASQWAAGGNWILIPPYAIGFGILIFSGSLYALAVTEIRILGAVTPIGGVAFLMGWLVWAWAAFRVHQVNS